MEINLHAVLTWSKRNLFFTFTNGLWGGGLSFDLDDDEKKVFSLAGNEPLFLGRPAHIGAIQSKQ
jgi:hypothetical protein